MASASFVANAPPFCSNHTRRSSRHCLLKAHMTWHLWLTQGLPTISIRHYYSAARPQSAQILRSFHGFS